MDARIGSSPFSGSRQASAPCRLEGLEPRILLATFTVTNALDAGAGSLRQAVLNANANVGADVIRFSPGMAGQRITLTGGQIAITDAVYVEGPGADLLTVDAGGASRVFHISDGTANAVQVRLDGLTLADGSVDTASECGGIICSAENLTLKGCVITGGLARHGGGVGILAGSVEILDATIDGNRAAAGAGVYVAGGALTLRRSTVSGNDAYGADGGGGVYVSAGAGTVLVDASTFSGNFGHLGGGLLSWADATVVNTTISGNRGHGAGIGGGVYAGGGTVTLIHVTVTGNVVADHGGGICVGAYGSLNLRNGLVVGNAAGGAVGSGPDAWSAGILTAAGSVFTEAPAGGYTDQGGNQVVADAGIDTVLSDNGGPTRTHALLPGSPAEEAGSPAFAAGLATDQRGLSRVAGSGPDVGAYEGQFAIISTPVVTAVEGDPYVYDLRWQGATGTVFVGWSQLPWMTEAFVDATTYRLSGTPDDAEVGPHLIDLSVIDATASLTQQFTLTVLPVNDVPVASSTAVDTDEDNFVDVDLWGLVDDVETPDAQLAFTVGGAFGGAVELRPDAHTARFTPTPHSSGTAGFTYSVTDTGDGDSAAVTVGPVAVDVAVRSVNDPPKTAPVAVTMAEDNSFDLNLWDAVSDTETPDDQLIFSVGDPVNGTVVLLPDGHTARFTPAPDYNGPASFTYTVTDTGDAPNPPATVGPVTVDVDVAPVNDAPAGLPGGATGEEDTSVDVDLRVFAEDKETPDDLLAFAVGDPVHGAVALLPDGHTARFTPTGDYNGAASFTYVVTDTGEGTAPALSAPPAVVTLTIDPVNDPPQLSPGAATINEDETLDVDLWGLADDVETADGQLTFEVAGAVDGTAALLADGHTVRFTPDLNHNGSAGFSFRVTDTGDGADGPITAGPADFAVTVNAINDAPVNTVPPTQRTVRNATVVFSWAGGNAVSVADIDATEGDGLLDVALTAFNGKLTLAGQVGLTSVIGNGTRAINLTGPAAAVNAALDGLAFVPDAGFYGHAGVNIVTADRGNAGAGGVKTDTDIVTIEVALPVSRGRPLTIPDADGDRIRIKVRGPGQGRVFVAPGEDVSLVDLVGSSHRTSLGIQPLRAGGQTTVGGVEVFGSLKRLLGKRVDLAGDVSTTGGLGSIRMADAAGGTITIGARGKRPTNIRFDHVADVNVDSANPIKRLRAVEWLNVDAAAEVISAPRMKRVQITGKRRGPAGNLEAGLVLTDPNVRKGLGKLQVNGWLYGCDVRSAAGVGAAILGGMRQANLFAGIAAGVTGLPDSVGVFQTPARIGRVVVGPQADGSASVIGGNIAAFVLANVRLNDVQSAGAEAFGLAATSIRHYVRLAGGRPVVQQSLWVGGNPVDDVGNFHVRVL